MDQTHPCIGATDGQRGAAVLTCSHLELGPFEPHADTVSHPVLHTQTSILRNFTVSAIVWNRVLQTGLYLRLLQSYPRDEGRV